MKALLCVIFFIAYIASYGQGSGFATNPQTVMGTITVPSLMSLEVSTNNNDVKFENLPDFTNGKYFPGVLTVKVVSCQSWVVSFKAIEPNFTALTPGASPDMPVSVMRLKRIGNDTWLPLSSTTQPLIYSDNSNIMNTYFFDARFDLGWNYRSGNYGTTVLFTLSPQ